MGRRGPTKHLKRINAPKHWMLDKLGGIFVSFFLRLRERALVFVACLGEGNCLGSGGGARGLLRTRGLSGAARPAYGELVYGASNELRLADQHS